MISFESPGEKMAVNRFTCQDMNMQVENRLPTSGAGIDSHAVAALADSLRESDLAGFDEQRCQQFLIDFTDIV